MGFFGSGAISIVNQGAPGMEKGGFYGISTCPAAVGNKYRRVIRLRQKKDHPMKHNTPEYLRQTLAHNRALLDDIIGNGLSRYYNTEIVEAACDAIEAELRRRGIL